MRKFLSFSALFLCLINIATAQKPAKPDAAEILLKLKKVNFLGNVLYLAAHPDDENTRLIAYLSNETLANTAYLSLTRGDGGQNLLGPEIREGLGVIRTQELLAARRIDGSKQYFSRANDFGYSKSAEETLQIWDKDEVLSDVVWVYRKFRPDVIITRFPPDKRAGHGHHTASAIMAREAFNLSGDKTQFSSQLKYVDTWQPRRLYTNTGRWWNPDMKGDEKGVLTVDVGKFNPFFGKSYTEIAALSRSKHKSQGFGSTGSRGEETEFLEYVMGDEAKKDIFDGIETTWKRVEGGEKIGQIINKAITEYKPSNPSAIMPELMEARAAILKLKDEYWKNVKLTQLDEVIKYACGLYLEVVADDYAGTPGDKISINIEAINRSDIPMVLESINYAQSADTVAGMNLDNNKEITLKTTLAIPVQSAYSQPYWLMESGTLGMYKVSDQKLIGKAENDPALIVNFKIGISGQTISFQSPLVYKWNDPVDGEQYRPFEIIPPAFIKIPEAVYIFPDQGSKRISVNLKAGKNGIAGKLKLEIPSGWKVNPESYDFDLSSKWNEAKFDFDIIPAKEQSTGEIHAVAEINGKPFSYSLSTISYDHIPTQLIMPPASAKVVKLDIKTNGDMIGYIQGAGDAIPSALREIGYKVVEMNEGDITPVNLKNLDAVILGVRALNTNDRIAYYMDDLLEYAKEGGTLIVQYNTNYRLKTDHFSPYPLELSRDRVTEEDAEVKILKPDHVVLNKPNKITQKDFDGWVQERGLYFPDKWDDHFEAILSSTDKDEKGSPKNGGLLVAKYGKGYYVYTGFSWFRELPAGVPGAYRLFVNLVSLGNNPEQTDDKTNPGESN